MGQSNSSKLYPPDRMTRSLIVLYNQPSSPISTYRSFEPLQKMKHQRRLTPQGTCSPQKLGILGSGLYE